MIATGTNKIGVMTKAGANQIGRATAGIQTAGAIRALRDIRYWQILSGPPRVSSSRFELDETSFELDENEFRARRNEFRARRNEPIGSTKRARRNEFRAGGPGILPRAPRRMHALAVAGTGQGEPGEGEGDKGEGRGRKACSSPWLNSIPVAASGRRRARRPGPWAIAGGRAERRKKLSSPSSSAEVGWETLREPRCCWHLRRSLEGAAKRAISTLARGPWPRRGGRDSKEERKRERERERHRERDRAGLWTEGRTAEEGEGEEGNEEEGAGGNGRGNGGGRRRQGRWRRTW